MEEPDARAVAAEAARRHGEPSSEPHLTRSGVNHVYRVGGLLVRVARSAVDVNQHVRTGTFLHENGVAVPEAIGSGEVGGKPYSVWEYIPADTPSSIDYAAVGAVVRTLHTIKLGSVAEFRLPRCHDLDRVNIDQDLVLARSANVLPTKDVDLLQAQAERLRSWRDHCRASSHQVVCHGDVHPGNVIMNNGRAVLIDWDTMCVGPPQWDHAMLLTLADRWVSQANTYSDFVEGYGEAYHDDPLAIELAEMRLLAATSSMIIKGANDERCAVEARLRMRYWRGERDAPAWAPR